MRTDWLLSFLAGVFAMAGLGYWFWRYSGSPPSEP